MFLSLDLNAAGKQKQNRPQWAIQSSEARPEHKDSIKTSQWNAGIRPGPVRPPVPRLSKVGVRASQRSNRSTPSKAMCTSNKKVFRVNVVNLTMVKLEMTIIMNIYIHNKNNDTIC